MKLTKEEKQFIKKVFDGYSENNELTEMDIIQIYPANKTGMRNNGYRDAIFFKAIIFNTESRQMKKLPTKHDKLSLSTLSMKVQSIIVFLDGSTLIKFDKPVGIGTYQALTFYDIRNENHMETS
jgi:hypothetical protein